MSGKKGMKKYPQEIGETVISGIRAGESRNSLKPRYDAVERGDEGIIRVKLNDIVSDSGVSFFSEDVPPIVNGYYSVTFTLSA